MLALEDREVDYRGRIGGKRSSQKPCFTPPPESKLEGDKGEALVRWVRQKDGKVQVVSVNGKELGDSEADEPQLKRAAEMAEEDSETPEEFTGESPDSMMG